jgi:4'-phosphopantetheinyl transferase
MLLRSAEGLREVHVWECCLAVADGSLARFQPVLSEEEKRRASRFHFACDRRRYIAAHGMLREILASYLETEPGKLRFRSGSSGKPRLASDPSDSDIRFSLSRSRDLSLVAVAVGVEIGVDIEYISPDVDSAEIAGTFFSVNEKEKLASLAGSHAREAFFRCWTRKEAFLKGMGAGLSQDPAAFEVTLLPGEPAALLHFPAFPEEAAGWTLSDLPAVPGFSASLAVQAPGAALVWRKWGQPHGMDVKGDTFHERTR